MKDLIVTTDLTTNSDVVVKSSYELAKQTNKKLSILHIDELYAQVTAYNLVEHFPREYKKDPVWNRRIETTTLSMIDDQLKRLSISKNDVNFYSVEGTKRYALNGFLEERTVDVVTVGSNDHGGLYRFFLGSFSEGVVFNSHCDCLLIKKEMALPLKHIMVSINLKNDNSYLIERAKAYAKEFGATVSLVYALPVNLVEYTDGDAEKFLNSDYLDDIKKESKEKIDKIITEFTKDRITVDGHLEMELGKPVSKVIEDYFNQSPADLVFVSPQHSFMHGMAIGGVCHTLIKDLGANFYITKFRD